MDNITTHQAKYLANHLTRRLYTAKNNQMEALFDFKFPLSKGAGIILSQHLAGYKRKLLIIFPANIHKLGDKTNGIIYN